MKRFGFVIIAIIALLCFAGCNSQYLLYCEIPNYDKVIGGVVPIPDKGDQTPSPPEVPDGSGKPDEEPSTPILPDDVPLITGYEPIIGQGADLPSDFGKNSLTPFTIGENRFLLDKCGKRFGAPSDLTALCYDKYIFEESGLKGVKSADGTLLIKAKYAKIDIVKNTILAANGEVIHIFDASMTDAAGNVMLVSEVSGGRFSAVSLYDEKLVAADGVLCGLNFRPRIFGGFSAVGESGGYAIVKDGNERLGFFDTVSGKLTVKPRYAAASFFVNGYAAVCETLGGENIIIDTDGRAVARFSGNTYGFYDGYMFADDEKTGGLKLFDGEFCDTGLKFGDVLGKRVHGDFVIDTLRGRLFSVSKREYVSTAFSDIVPTVGGFICKNDGRAQLVDFDLNTVCEAEDIRADGDGLNVRLNGRYYYFAPIERK